MESKLENILKVQEHKPEVMLKAKSSGVNIEPFTGDNYDIMNY